MGCAALHPSYRLATVQRTANLAVLRTRGGGSQDNLVRSFRFADTPALRALRGQSLQGAWKLRVADLEAAEVGKLNRWDLNISC